MGYPTKVQLIRRKKGADQYYIKTSEYFTDYRWKAPGAISSLYTFSPPVPNGPKIKSQNPI